jgi:polyphosphate kinase
MPKTKPKTKTLVTPKAKVALKPAPKMTAKTKAKSASKAVIPRVSSVPQKSLHLSRERSWLGFNHRVLLQATRPDFPLLERVRFLSIFSNNQDEFFTARVHPMQGLVRAGNASESVKTQYFELLEFAHTLAKESASVYALLVLELARSGIRILETRDLTTDELNYFGAFLSENVAPFTDIIAPSTLEFLDSRAYYFAAGGSEIEALFRLPPHVPRLLEVPGREACFVRLETLVQERSDLFLPKALPTRPLRVTRAANLDLKGAVDWEELAHALESRLDGIVARLEVAKGFPWLSSVTERLSLRPEECFEIEAPLDLRFLEQIADLDRPDLKFKADPIRKRAKFFKTPFGYLEKQDLALYHPSDDYSTVVNFVIDAANDPQTEVMRATLYRLGHNNPIAEALLEAAANGKDVAVFLEGRARFDELANLYWMLRFQQAGVLVLPYPADLKVHAKALYVRRAGKGFVHLGTGNYNPSTARLYTDLSVITASKRLSKDVLEFFTALEESRAPKMEFMKVGLTAREFMLKQIQAEAHPKGHIILKLNHLTDPGVLKALAHAANAGAKVELIIRSSLTLIHPKFKVRSLVGRYLEHARIAAFRNNDDWQVWAGSADWMPRNFERRLEMIFPILDKKVRVRMLKVLRAQLEDTKNAFVLDASGRQRALWGGTKDSQVVRL